MSSSIVHPSSKHQQSSSSTPPASVGVSPEWFTVAEACGYGRFSKGLLYSLLERGLIRNVSLRQRGQTKGKRLISADSLREFLNSRATGGTTQVQ